MPCMYTYTNTCIWYACVVQFFCIGIDYTCGMHACIKTWCMCVYVVIYIYIHIYIHTPESTCNFQTKFKKIKKTLHAYFTHLLRLSHLEPDIEPESSRTNTAWYCWVAPVWPPNSSICICICNMYVYVMCIVE